MNELLENGTILATPSNTHLTWAVSIGFAFLALAVGIELYRRRKDRRLRLAAEWRAVQQIAEEKELSRQEMDTLFPLLNRYASGHPLRAVTLRQHFNILVDTDIDQAEKHQDLKQLEAYGARLRDIRIRLGLDYIPFGQRIHTTRELYHGQTIWLAPQAPAQTEWLRMSVVDVDEAFFQLAPHRQDMDFPLTIGQTVRCRMWREEDARYLFDARIVDLTPSPPRWVMAHALDLKRQQSRAHFRIHFEQAAEIRLLNASRDQDYSDVYEREPTTTLRGRITSLSGGGLAVIVQQPVSKQVLLRTSLELREEKVDVVARLVGDARLSSGQYLLRAAFVGLSDDRREIITHYVFKQQQPKLTDADEPSKEHA